MKLETMVISRGLEEVAARDYYNPINIWGDYMKEFRKETGMSQSKFAEYFGLSVRNLQEWEQGRKNPPPYLLNLLKRIWKLENGEP